MAGLRALLILMLLLAVVVYGASNYLESDYYWIEIDDHRPPVSELLLNCGLSAEEIWAAMPDQDPVSIFDEELEPRVRKAYLENPWVRRVLEVEREFPNGIRVEVEFREPFAAVEVHGQLLTVDQDGELLPLGERNAQIARFIRPPLISFAAVQVRDEAWFRAAVKEGCAILEDLESVAASSVFESIGVRKIDVSNFGLRRDRNSSEAVLVSTADWVDTKQGQLHPVTIRWGRSQAHESAAIELPLKRKIEHLSAILRTFPALKGLRFIDVRWDQSVAKPL